jgi:hypothetical protein
VLDENGNSLNYNLRRPKSRSQSNSRTASVISEAESSDSYNTFTDGNRTKRLKTKAEEKLYRIERNWSYCQDAMKALTTLGYRVESKIDGEWTQPAVWKLTGPDNDDSDSDLPKGATIDHLVMAAEWASNVN